MSRMEAPNGRTDLRANLPSTSGGRLLEVDAWIPNEIKAISPLVERLMRLIEGSHCITGEEHAAELALREALSNAVVDGNRLDAHKLVHVRCRCKVGKGISPIVSHQGQEFDAHNVPDSVAAENLEAKSFGRKKDCGIARPENEYSERPKNHFSVGCPRRKSPERTYASRNPSASV